MSKYTSRFFGELKPGLHFVLGTTNTGKTSVLMNDAKDRSQHEPVEYINVEMNHNMLKQFFWKTNTNITTFPYSDTDILQRVVSNIVESTANYIYIDLLQGILLPDKDKQNSYGKLIDSTVIVLNSIAKLYNKTIIVTVNGNSSMYVSGMNKEYSEAMKKNVSSIFEITREDQIIFINGKKFELDQYRNLKEIVKKEQTLLEAVDILNEEIDSIAIFPEDHSYGLVYKYVSGIEVVEFLGKTIYRSDIEERIYDEDTDEYESYESFLRRVVCEISRDVYSIFCKLTP